MSQEDLNEEWLNHPPENECEQERKKSLMYTDKNGERLPAWNPHPGCRFNCKYCYGPKIYQRSQCKDCRAFEPHFHPERMNKTFQKGKTYFVESLGDPYFIDPILFQDILKRLSKFPKSQFMIQSKSPACFTDTRSCGRLRIPENVWLGTTIETNFNRLARGFSKAPGILQRCHALRKAQEEYPELHFYLTFEPIMIFDLCSMLEIARWLDVDAVYIGRDNHGHHLPEPAEWELKVLVRLLQEQLGPDRVHTKTLGPAWWERK